jgi:hypothetical protein
LIKKYWFDEIAFMKSLKKRIKFSIKYYSKNHHFNHNIFKSPWATWKETEIKNALKWAMNKRKKTNPKTEQIPQVSPNISLIKSPQNLIQVIKK